LKRYRPLARWVLLTLLVLCAMRAAANHFLPASKEDQKIDFSKFKPTQSKIAAYINSWWNPNLPISDSVTLDSETASKSAATSPSTVSSVQPKALTPAELKGVSVNLQGAPIGTNSVASQVAAGSLSGAAGAPGVPNWRGTRSVPAVPQIKEKLPLKTLTPQVQAATLTVSSGISQISQGKSVVPIDHSAQLSDSPLSGGATLDLAPLGSNPAVPIYAILGLSKSSTPSSDTDSSGNLIASVSNDVSSDADLHFSLSGQLSATPTYSIAEDTSSIVPLSTPEPTISGLLAGGAAILTLRRRRVAARKA
jgi:hypothetical protein